MQHDALAPAPPVRGARERFERMHRILRERICLLDHPPGTRLREEAIAAEFGVSRTPVRRVLGHLEAQGLVRSVHGVGTLVTDVDPRALDQVYALRMELAELIGRLDPLPPDPGTVGAFREIQARSEALAADPRPRRFAQLNMDFFHALMRLTGNRPLRAVCEQLYYQTTRIWLMSIPQMDLAAESAAFGREVAEVLSAVELGELRAVGLIRRTHIAMSRRRLLAGREPE